MIIWKELDKCTSFEEKKKERKKERKKESQKENGNNWEYIKKQKLGDIKHGG